MRTTNERTTHTRRNNNNTVSKCYSQKTLRGPLEVQLSWFVDDSTPQTNDEKGTKKDTQPIDRKEMSSLF